MGENSKLVRQLAEELRVLENNLYNWRKQLREKADKAFSSQFYYSISPVSRQHVSYADNTPLFQLLSLMELGLSFFFILLYRRGAIIFFNVRSRYLEKMRKVIYIINIRFLGIHRTGHARKIKEI